MYIEECISLTVEAIFKEGMNYSNKRKKVADSEFFLDLHKIYLNGNPLTTTQAEMAIRKMKRNEREIASISETNLNKFKKALDSKKFRRTPIEVETIQREVRYLGRNLIGFRFSSNTKLVNNIMEISSTFYSSERAHFDNDLKIWLVKVFHDNALKVLEFITKNRFKTDALTEDFFKLSTEAKVTTVSIENGKIQIDVLNAPEISSFCETILKGESNV